MPGASYTVTVYEGLDGQWRYRVTNDQNGQVVGGNHDGHVRKSHAVKMAESIYEGAVNVTLGWDVGSEDA